MCGAALVGFVPLGSARSFVSSSSHANALEAASTPPVRRATRKSQLVMKDSSDETLSLSRRGALLSIGLIGTALALHPTDSDALSLKRLKFVTDWESFNGMRVREIKIGNGISPRDGDICAIHFSIFYDNLEVVSTRESSGLAASPVGFTFGASAGPGAIMPGIMKGVDGMKVGGLRLLEIPPELAFGKRGKKPLIPENATIEVAVQLLSVKRSGTNPNVSPGFGSSMF
mmetsp:Transcript_2497/g.5596  ORF Transcript_2497/g.5596 Transcript_2497/m.5596 type:complete len:229 (+) Transcript_2497:106-792(+)